MTDAEYDEPDDTETGQNQSEFGPNAWDRLPNEPEAWYFRFKRYLRAGLNRSFLGTYNAERAEKGRKKALRISGAWERRVKQFTWEQRARAYDADIEKQEQAEWDKQRRDFRSKELALAQNLIRKAEQMLQFPVAVTKQEQMTEGGKTIVQTTILPAKWNFRDAAQIIDTADKLTRLALELDTERTAVDATLGSPQDIEAIRQQRWQQIAPQLRDALSQLSSEQDIQQRGQASEDDENDNDNATHENQ